MPPARGVEALPREAFTIWMTGLSGAGKSTLAEHILLRLQREGRACHVLDGDALRDGLSSDLGFSRADRHEQVRRVAHVARILNESGVVVIVALVSPYRADRQLARRIIGSHLMHEVWVCTPLQVCQLRDPKGLYRRAHAGQIPAMTGITDPYEPPQDEALHIDTSTRDIETCSDAILDAIAAHCAEGSHRDAL